MRHVSIGSTASTAFSAISAAREGTYSDLVSPMAGFYAMIGEALGQTDRSAGDVSTRSSMVLEYYTRVARKANIASGDFLFGNMKVARQVLDEMIAEVSTYLTVSTGKPLESVTKNGADNAILSVRCGGTDFPARNFSDGTDQLDLARMHQCMTRAGRDGVRASGNPTAGVREFNVETVSARDSATGERLPGVAPCSSQPFGTADLRLMGWNKRIIVTQDATRIKWADIPITIRPEEDYESEFRIAVARNLTTIPGSIGRELLPINGPEQHDMNNGGLVRLGSNRYGFFLQFYKMTQAQRDLHALDYDRYILGLLKCIATSTRWQNALPACVTDTKAWGLDPTIFQDSFYPGMAHSIYEREGFQIVGRGFLRLKDAFAPAANDVATSCAVFNYGTIDGHHVQKGANGSGMIYFEGGGGLAGGQQVVPQQMPLGCLQARLNDAPNLMVSRGYSSDRLGFIPGRIEQEYLKFGEINGLCGGIAEAKGIYTGYLDYKTHLLPKLDQRNIMYRIPGVA